MLTILFYSLFLRNQLGAESYHLINLTDKVGLIKFISVREDAAYIRAEFYETVRLNHPATSSQLGNFNKTKQK